MALNINAQFDGKLTCAFNNDIKNLANFHQRTRESKNWDSISFLSKVENI